MHKRKQMALWMITAMMMLWLAVTVSAAADPYLAVADYIKEHGIRDNSSDGKPYISVFEDGMEYSICLTDEASSQKPLYFGANKVGSGSMYDVGWRFGMYFSGVRGCITNDAAMGPDDRSIQLTTRAQAYDGGWLGMVYPVSYTGPYTIYQGYPCTDEVDISTFRFCLYRFDQLLRGRTGYSLKELGMTTLGEVPQDKLGLWKSMLENPSYRHTYETVTVPATEYAEGSITKRCSQCYEVAEKTTIPRLPSKSETGSSGNTGTGSTSSGTISTVTGLAKGKKATVNKVTYKALSSKNVMVTSISKNLTKVTIPAKVKIKGVTYNVTEIGANACANAAKLTTVTIGSNVAKIGSKAFYGCKKLKSLTISTTKLTTKKVGAKAFSGTPAKIVVKVPSSKVTAYKSMLKNKGINKKATIKKK